MSGGIGQPQNVADNGAWTPIIMSPMVGVNDIRRWAIATYWPERPPEIYTDGDELIAPRDFNPFTWLLDPIPGPQGGNPEDFPNHRHVMNGGQTDLYGVYIRPGDVISSRSRIATIESRETRLGDARFITKEHVWLNQRNEFVRTRLSTLIRY
jgi:hypothetical protein